VNFTACTSVERSTDALTDARMVTEAGAWVHTQGYQVPASPYIFLLLTHQAVPPGMEMGSRGSRGRGPGSLGEPGGGDLGGLSSPDLGLDLSLIISK
jgi:hypothetical protein